MDNKELNRKRLIITLLTPIFSLYNATFYKAVILRRFTRSIGFSYLMALALVLSIPMSIKIQGILDAFNNMGLSQMVAKLPSSYLDSNGTLSPQDGESNLVYVNNRNGNLFILYNTKDENVQLDKRPPFEIKSRSLAIKAGDDVITIPWSSFSGSPLTISATDASFLIDKILTSSFLSLYMVICMWLFIIVAFNALIVGFLANLALKFLTPRLKLGYKNTLSCACYANTIVAIIMALQFFIYLPISFNMMAIISFSYILFAAMHANKDLAYNEERLKVYIKVKNADDKDDDINLNKDKNVKDDNNGSGGSFQA